MRRTLSRPGVAMLAAPLLVLGLTLSACGGASSTPNTGSPQANAPAGSSSAANPASSGSSSGAGTVVPNQSGTSGAQGTQKTQNTQGSQGSQGTQATQGSQGDQNTQGSTSGGSQAGQSGSTGSQAPATQPKQNPTTGSTAPTTGSGTTTPPKKVTPTQAPAPPKKVTPTQAPVPAALSWNLVVWYTPVEQYYSGATQALTGCLPNAPDTCGDTTAGTSALGSFPTSFVTAVENVDDGLISSGPYAGDYLSYDDPGWEIDLASDEDPQTAFSTAEADVAVGTKFQVTSCGTQGGVEIPASVCAPLMSGNWTVTDSNEGTTLQEVDLYVGMQTASFPSSALGTMNSAGAHTTLPAPSAAYNN